MSINVDLLSSFASAGTANNVKRVFDMTLEEARKTALENIKVGKPNTDGVKTVSVRVGKRSIELQSIFVDHKKENVKKLSSETVTSFKVQTDSDLEKLKNVLYTCLSNGVLDPAIEKAQDQAREEHKQSEEKRAAKKAEENQPETE